MRLLDHILAEGFLTLSPELERDKASKSLRSAQLVVIDNVATFKNGDFIPDKIDRYEASAGSHYNFR
jgi:hypothetical protein